jgi:hypothetical protein
MMRTVAQTFPLLKCRHKAPRHKNDRSYGQSQTAARANKSKFSLKSGAITVR